MLHLLTERNKISTELKGSKSKISDDENESVQGK